VSSHAGVAGAMEAVVRLLRASYDPADFNGAVLDFQVYVSDDFTHPMEQGVSLFLYRLYPNPAIRTPQGRLLPDGRRQRAKLPVELHFLATAWAKKASLQHEIAGWMMRVLEDNPVLPAGLLNSYRPGVFQPEETVTVALTDLSVEDVFRIWEVMIDHTYQISVPYLARTIELESMRADTLFPPVQERVFGPGILVEP
jgi:Pvc16 N-terminal domain